VGRIRCTGLEDISETETDPGLNSSLDLVVDETLVVVPVAPNDTVSVIRISMDDPEDAGAPDLWLTLVSANIVAALDDVIFGTKIKRLFVFIWHDEMLITAGCGLPSPRAKLTEVKDPEADCGIGRIDVLATTDADDND
jgi:hypothetical protein